MFGSREPRQAQIFQWLEKRDLMEANMQAATIKLFGSACGAVSGEWLFVNGVLFLRSMRFFAANEFSKGWKSG